MIAMPKADKVVAVPPHRNSISTASAAGGGGGSRSSSWSAKDDETLVQARAQGLNWNQIAPKFPGKSPNACRKRHERLMERQNAEQWDGVKLEDLAQAYMEVRREMWSILGARVNEKWQVVEQKCMEKGLKNLSQANRSARKKLGTYDGHDDSGISGFSDLESDDRPEAISEAIETPTQQFSGNGNGAAGGGGGSGSGAAAAAGSGYPSHPHHQQRVPSIHSILQHNIPMQQQQQRQRQQQQQQHQQQAANYQFLPTHISTQPQAQPQ